MTFGAIVAAVLSASALHADESITGYSAKFDAASAKPGATVTLRLAVQLAEPWHTYPLVQPDEGAASYVNKLRAPATADVIPVGKPIDPPNPISKSDKIQKIESLLSYSGSAVYEVKVVVSPRAKAGSTVEFPVKLQVMCCDENTCLPPKTLEMVAKIRVEGDPVAVEAKYAAEVEKALKK